MTTKNHHHNNNNNPFAVVARGCWPNSATAAPDVASSDGEQSPMDVTGGGGGGGAASLAPPPFSTQLLQQQPPQQHNNNPLLQQHATTAFGGGRHMSSMLCSLLTMESGDAGGGRGGGGGADASFARLPQQPPAITSPLDGVRSSPTSSTAAAATWLLRNSLQQQHPAAVLPTDEQYGCDPQRRQRPASDASATLARRLPDLFRSATSPKCSTTNAIINGGGAAKSAEGDDADVAPSSASFAAVDKLMQQQQPVRRRRKVPEGKLCAVCSDRATGYHYGVASCNGCKTFFRRTLVTGQHFVCQHNGDCDVTKSVRCSCRHCRFNKCVRVGMDPNAIQNDRDRIGPLPKQPRVTTTASSSAAAAESKFSPNGTEDDHFDGLSTDSSTCEDHVLRRANEKLMERVVDIENRSNILRFRLIDNSKTLKESLALPSLLFDAEGLLKDENSHFKELFPASMCDIQMWNIREMRIFLEWAKAFELFQTMPEEDRLCLLKHFAFSFNILNRVFYSIDCGPDKIVYPNGAYILRQQQDRLRIPGCRSIYHRQMDEIQAPLRRMGVTLREFAAFKATLFWNPEAGEFAPEVKAQIAQERERYTALLFHMITDLAGFELGLQKYSNLLLMSQQLQSIIDQNEENMTVMEVFGHFWRINPFVKEICMK